MYMYYGKVQINTLFCVVMYTHACYDGNFCINASLSCNSCLTICSFDWGLDSDLDSNNCKDIVNLDKTWKLSLGLTTLVKSPHNSMLSSQISGESWLAIGDMTTHRRRNKIPRTTQKGWDRPRIFGRTGSNQQLTQQPHITCTHQRDKSHFPWLLNLFLHA